MSGRIMQTIRRFGAGLARLGDSAFPPTGRYRRLGCEPLEQRRLLTVLLDNDLPADDPDYFGVHVGRGGGTHRSIYADTNTIFEYSAYLDVDGQVFNLSSAGSEPVLQGDKAVSEASFSSGDGTIDVYIESRIPAGSGWLINAFTFTASGGVDLRDARLFQYLDADIFAVSDDVLTVSGSVAGNDLTVTTVDPATHVKSLQILGQPLLGAVASGFAADRYADLESAIIRGGYDVPSEGSIDTGDLPPQNFPGIGDGYGPHDITTAIEYEFTNATSAVVRTTLGVTDVAVGVPDLVVTYVSEPTAVQRGESFTVDWIVQNRSDTPVTQPSFNDAVYLSADQVLGPDDLPVGTLEHTGGLDARTVYNASLLIDTAGVPDDTYYVIVATDSDDVVEEARLEENNAISSEGVLWIGVPELTPGVPLAGVLEADADRHYYVVDVAAGEHLQITIDDANHVGSNELYVRYGQPPTRSQYDFRYEENLSADQQVNVADTLPGLYYVMVYGESVPDAPASYGILAELLPFSVIDIGTNAASNNGAATLRIRGARFNDSMTVELVAHDATMIASETVAYVDSSEIWATMDLTVANQGLYDVRITKSGEPTVTLTDAFTVFSEGGSELHLDLIGPGAVRAGRQGVMHVEVTNLGSNDSYVPVVWVRPLPGMAVGTEPTSLAEVDELLLDVHPSDAPLPIIVPGARVRVPVYYRAPLATGANSIVVQMYNAPLHAEPDKAADCTSVSGATDTDPSSLSWEDDDYTYQLDAHAGGPSFGTTTSFFAGALTSEFASPRWEFQYGTVAGTPTSGNTSFSVWYSNARAGACLTASPSVPWIQVVDALVWSPSVDPRPGGPGRDNLPFYYSTAEAGNSSTARSFTDLPGISLEYMRSRAASSSSRSYTDTFEAELHSSSWSPPLDPAPATETVQVSNSGVTWGYTLTVQAKDPDEEDEEDVDVIGSWDPNEKVAPAGFGQPQYVAAGSPMPYTVYFENDPDLATAPAQEVRVTDTLDPDLDWSTFELTEFAFGNQVIDVPPGLNYYTTTVDLRPHGTDLLVDIEAGLDSGTGTVLFSFTSLDPDTLALPEDPFAGFLPVNDETGRGEGHVSYLVYPQAGLATGTEITNSASIVFDVNDPIVTNQVLNTIDAVAPQSRVDSLPERVMDPSVIVTFGGQDDPGGSGVAGYDVYVSDNGGPFQRWLSGATDTSAEFLGVAGHTYTFYSVATDNVGNREPAPEVPDAQTAFGQLVKISTPGLYDPLAGAFHLRDSNSAGPADVEFNYGPRWYRGCVPLAGDWDGDGVDTVGLYDPRRAVFHLKNSNSNPPVGADVIFRFGPIRPWWQPIAGDFDGDGIDTVGLYDPLSATFHLKNSHIRGPADAAFRYGPVNSSTWRAIVGDWDGDGVDSVGLYDAWRAGFHLKNVNATLPRGADVAFRFGPVRPWWRPLAGDFDGDGVATVGLYDPDGGGFHLKNSHGPGGGADLAFRYGPAMNFGWTPLVGDWDGPGQIEPASAAAAGFQAASRSAADTRTVAEAFSAWADFDDPDDDSQPAAEPGPAEIDAYFSEP